MTYLIDEICMQSCEDDIRLCLKNLPQDLRATYARAIVRVITWENASVAKEIFPWIAAAKRPLTLEELSEAVSLQVGQSSSNPGRWLKNGNRILAWCGNLLELDEEYRTVQFAHQTIHTFITEPD